MELFDDKQIQSIIRIITGGWKLNRALERAALKMDIRDQTLYLGHFRHYKREIAESLELIDMRILDFEGQDYSIGMAARALNVEEFDSNEQVLVVKMIEPTIMKNNTVIFEGIMILGRKN